MMSFWRFDTPEFVVCSSIYFLGLAWDGTNASVSDKFCVLSVEKVVYVFLSRGSAHLGQYSVFELFKAIGYVTCICYPAYSSAWEVDWCCYKSSWNLNFLIHGSHFCGTEFWDGLETSKRWRWIVVVHSSGYICELRCRRGWVPIGNMVASLSTPSKPVFRRPEGPSSPCYRGGCYYRFIFLAIWTTRSAGSWKMLRKCRPK